MNPQQIQNLIQQGIESYMTQKQFNASKIPNHLHNGVDTNKIEQVNVLNGIKYSARLIEKTVETFSFDNVPNPRRISFYGFAANNADGTPATKRAILNGEIEFGTCLSFQGSGVSISFANGTPAVPFMQHCNGMYVDSTTLANNKVFSSSTDFAFALDETGATIAQLTLISYSNNTLTIQSQLGTNWQVTGEFTVT